MTATFHHGHFVCPNNGCRNCLYVIITEEVTLEELKERYGDFMAIEDAYGNPKVTTSNDAAFEKEPRFGAKQGILRTQPEGPQGSNGRRPPVQEVKAAEVEKGAATRCAKKQLGENLKPMNSYVKSKEEYGPNN